MPRSDYSLLHMEQVGESGQRVADRITEAIRGSGVTLVWLCDRTGIPRSTMNRRMAHPSDFTVNELERVASALRIDVSSLVGEAAAA